MTRYRPLGALALAIAAMIVANVAAPMLLTDLAARQAWAGTLLGAVVLMLVFVYRAARTLEVIGDSHPRFTPGQSVGWLLVPLVNIYMAHQILTSLWRDSQPTSGVVRSRGVDFSVAAVNVWLALVLVRLLVPAVLSDLVLVPHAATLHTALWGAQGMAFLVVVFGIVGRQAEQWVDLEQRRAVPKPSGDALR